MKARRLLAGIVIGLAALLSWRWIRSDGENAPVLAASQGAPAGSEATSARTDQDSDANATRTLDSGNDSADQDEVHFFGRLMREGVPLAAVRVFRVLRAPRTRQRLIVMRRQHVATSDSSGRFAIAGTAGNLRLTFEGPQVPGGFITTVRLFPDQKEATNIEIPRTRRVYGRTRDSDRAPLGNVRVAFEQQANPWAARETVTGPDGRFELAVMPSDGKLGFELEGYCRTRRVVLSSFALTNRGMTLDSIHALEQGAFDIDVGTVRLHRPAKIHGVVVDRAGRPLKGAYVSATYWQAKDSARCDGRGAFSIIAKKPSIDELYVSAAGYVRRKLDSSELRGQERGDHARGQQAPDEGPRGPLRIELRRAAELECEVLWGEGLSPSKLSWKVDAGSAGWDAAYSLASDLETYGRSQMVRPGRYEIVARAGSQGVSSPVRVTLVAGKFKRVRVRIEAHPRLDLLVRDAQGNPVVGAQCIAKIESANGATVLDGVSFPDVRASSNAQGYAELRIPDGRHTNLSVLHPEYLPWNEATILGQGRQRVILARAGRLRGTVATQVLAHWSPSIELRKLAQALSAEADPTIVRRLSVDARGHFAANSLEPGSYELTLCYESAQISASRRCLLGDPADPRTRWRVRVSAGNTARVHLEPPPLGVLRGRVLRHGRAVPYALVEANWLGASHGKAGDLQHPGASAPTATATNEGVTNAGVTNANTGLQASSRFRAPADKLASCASDHRGVFEFYYATENAWRLAVSSRKALLPGPSKDVLLLYESKITNVNLEVGGSSLRGRVDLSALDQENRDRIQRHGAQILNAYLFTPQEAHHDAFALDLRGWLPTYASGMPSAELEADGSFAIDDVPKGKWLLRIASVHGTVLHRVVTIAAPAQLELGVLRPRTTHSIEVKVLTKSGAAKLGQLNIYRRDDSFAGRIYVASAWLSVNAASPTHAKLRTQLPAGSYEIQAAESSNGTLGPTYRLEIDDKGAVTPKTLRF